MMLLAKEMEDLLKDFLNNYLNSERFLNESGQLRIDDPKNDSLFWSYMQSFDEIEQKIASYQPETEDEKLEKDRSLALLKAFSRELFQTFCFKSNEH